MWKPSSPRALVLFVLRLNSRALVIKDTHTKNLPICRNSHTEIAAKAWHLRSACLCHEGRVEADLERAAESLRDATRVSGCLLLPTARLLMTEIRRDVIYQNIPKPYEFW